MSKHLACSICGEDSGPGNDRLVAVGCCEDTLVVTRWTPDVRMGNMHMACCPGHVQELASQWIVTGALAFPFARAVLGIGGTESGNSLRGQGLQETMCELKVHPESIERLLSENSRFLDTMLHALGDALAGHWAVTEMVAPTELREDFVQSAFVD